MRITTTYRVPMMFTYKYKIRGEDIADCAGVFNVTPYITQETIESVRRLVAGRVGTPKDAILVTGWHRYGR